MIAENAAIDIVIGYAYGDNPKYVTQNLTLQTKIGSADILWLSNSGAILTDGTVTRQTEDAEVTLTATAAYNGKSSEPGVFELRVIRKRTRDNSTIGAVSIAEASSGDIEITRNESGDITDIEGQYVSFDIQNADDALDAVTVLRDELGIRSPNTELKVFLVHSHSSGAEYAFQQVHNGVKVFGRRAMVSTNSKGKGNFLHSSLLSSDIVAKVDSKNDIGKSSAENIVKNEYADGIEIDSEATERIIYDFGNDDPVYAYIVRVYGVSGNQYVDENVFVNTDTSEIIDTSPNIHNLDAHGKNEISEEVLTFPVEQQGNKFLMIDTDLHLHMREYGTFTTVSGNTDYFSDREQVSAYTNMREIMKWWKTSFDRNSLDGNGGELRVLLNACEPGWEDNAGWVSSKERLYVFRRVNCKYSAGSDVGVLTHETQHGVMFYIVGNLGNNGRQGAISEGYADVFACLKNTHWKIADVLYNTEINGIKFDCLRNAADPYNINSVTG